MEDSSYQSLPGAVPAGETAQRHIAFFVSSHGFGHATRACAVMAAVQALDPSITFDILSAAAEIEGLVFPVHRSCCWPGLRRLPTDTAPPAPASS